VKFPAGLRGAAAFKLAPGRFVSGFYHFTLQLIKRQSNLYIYDNSAVKCLKRCAAREQKEGAICLRPLSSKKAFNEEINFFFVTLLSFHCVYTLALSYIPEFMPHTLQVILIIL
jgi:hypothetical protein